MMKDLANSTEKNSHLYKILVIGDYAVGKTSLIKRYTEGVFTANYKLTIGVDFAVKSLKWQDGASINLQLWDIAGHERFGCMTHVYYKYAIAALIVFDLTRPATFEAVIKWKEDLDNKVMLSTQQPVPCLLIANKCDRDDVQIDRDRLDLFCQAHGFIGWYATSASENLGIEEAMNTLVSNILRVARETGKPKSIPVGLSLEVSPTIDKPAENQQSCCSN